MKIEGRLSFVKEGENPRGKWWLYRLAGNRFFATAEQTRELNEHTSEYCELEIERGGNAWQYAGGVTRKLQPSNDELMERDLATLRPAVHAIRRFSQEEGLGLTGSNLLDAAWRLKTRAEKKGA